MIELTTETLAGIECLHATPAGQRHQPLPTMLFYHGFTSSKEVYAYFAVALAQAGFRAVMPDAALHGARYDGDAETRLDRFWEILKQNIDELPQLEAALRNENLIAGERFAVAGASMGGMTALGIMVRYPQVVCAASLMGSAYFTSLAQTLFPPQSKVAADAIMAALKPWEAADALQQLSERPLLLWHGNADEVVPAVETYRLKQALHHEGLDGNLTCLFEAGVTHRITPMALTATVEFFHQHL